MKKRVYVIRVFLQNDTTGKLYKMEFEGDNAENEGKQWLEQMGVSIELFSEGWEYQ